MAASHPFSSAVVVMGVASCGKTTIGEALAQQLHVGFTEGDKLHSAGNVAKMSSGTPLTDEDRWPWLAQGRRIAARRGMATSYHVLRSRKPIVPPLPMLRKDL